MPQGQPEMLKPDEAGIGRAAALLSQGALVAIPTETVYGLGADARNDRAVAEIFAAKGRPQFNPLIVHLADPEMAERFAEVGAMARALAGAFWPGPLTLVLPLRAGHGLSPLVSAGLPSVALRVPAHPVAHALLSGFGGPIAAPSANPSGRISPTSAAHVADGLGGRVAAILDAGPTSVGVESTILGVEDDRVTLLREGGLPREAIEAMTGPLASNTTPARITAPGQLESHYAPQVPLVSGAARPEWVRIGFGPDETAEFNLSPGGDLVEAAANLFAVLHAADALARNTNRPGITVAPIPDKGLGRAINDRLRRAAAPKG
ncbi:threonylcarbamoyl-AMP synthase [Rhodobacterales bacterium HKCCE3408]|nr:threonylcarbamoyl-AMP synthase [Rhodobacterales bacterium HKCCE3408]